MPAPRFNGRRIDELRMRLLLDLIGSGALSEAFETFLAENYIERMDRQIASLKRRRGRLEHGTR